jgi:hypothetical protein
MSFSRLQASTPRSLKSIVKGKKKGRKKRKKERKKKH